MMSPGAIDLGQHVADDFPATDRSGAALDVAALLQVENVNFV